MTNDKKLLSLISHLVEEDGRYSVDAYMVIMDALTEFAADSTKSRGEHVGGKQLSLLLCKQILKKYGPFSQDVVDAWGITSTKDFGIMVFKLAEIGLLALSKDDKLEDFVDCYNLKEVFFNCRDAKAPFPDMPVVFK